MVIAFLQYSPANTAAAVGTPWLWCVRGEGGHGIPNLKLLVVQLMVQLGPHLQRTHFFPGHFSPKTNTSTAEFCCFLTEALVGFLDFYGHRFDPQSLGVRRWRGLHHWKASEDVLNPRRSAMTCFWRNHRNTLWVDEFGNLPNLQVSSRIRIWSHLDQSTSHRWRLYGVSVARSAFLPRKSPLSWPPQQAIKTQTFEFHLKFCQIGLLQILTVTCLYCDLLCNTCWSCDQPELCMARLSWWNVAFWLEMRVRSQVEQQFWMYEEWWWWWWWWWGWWGWWTWFTHQQVHLSLDMTRGQCDEMDKAISNDLDVIF